MRDFHSHKWRIQLLCEVKNDQHCVGNWYVYELEAGTGGGTSVSDKYVIQTPVSSPTGIRPPHDVTVLGPHSVSLAWTPPGGCGVGEGVYARTLETAPEGQLAPTVKAAGARVLEIHWSPPQKPNGLITSYDIYRRPVGTEEELLVCIWSSGPLEFYDASPALRPFSRLQYRVRSHNSKGSALSRWALALTLQAEPQDMAPPTVTPTGEFTKSHDGWLGSNVFELN
ncbi:Usherin [Liparis tanakae]|uniref:Usherin n=1 Tax=Liparis tanakae TaxID=230148 RepID=A0A4Z2HMW6_9TELE|nr:Usherin [Liparis tanakae]